MHVSLVGRRDLVGQIYGQIRAAVLDGRLRAGDALPATREMAVRLEVSRNTVSAAYDRLVAEGFLVTRTGAGTFVASGVRSEGAVPSEGALRARPVWESITTPPDLTERLRYDLRPGHPDVRLFPFETWRRLMSAQLRAGAVGSGMYGDPSGHPGLRAAIARHVGVSRSVQVEPEDVVVTSGAQQAIDLITRVLIEPGSAVAVEDPGYPPVRHALIAAGMRVHRIPVDDEGLIVDALPPETRLVSLTPSHQFPLGMPMSLRRRVEMLRWADEHDAVLVEDDYDSEFRFGGRPIEPLHAVDTTGRVVYVGSFSKVMLPTLRMGFLIAPPSLRRALRTAKYVMDWHVPWPQQAALAEFLNEGLLAKHIRRMRREYASRHAALLEHLPGALRPIPSAAGLHLSALLPQAVDDRSVAEAARIRGVDLFALSQFGENKQSGLVLGYGAIGLPDLRRSLLVLDEALAEFTDGADQQ